MSNTLGDVLQNVIQDTKTTMCSAEILQKSKIQLFYDPDSYQHPTLTGFIYLPEELDKDGQHWEVEFSLGPVSIIDIHMNNNSIHPADPELGYLDIIKLPVIVTDPLPGNTKQPRFDITEKNN